MKRKSCVPKYIEREEGKSPGGDSTLPMNFHKRGAKRPRPDTGKKLTKSHNTGNPK